MLLAEFADVLVDKYTAVAHLDVLISHPHLAVYPLNLSHQMTLRFLSDAPFATTPWFTNGYGVHPIPIFNISLVEYAQMSIESLMEMNVDHYATGAYLDHIEFPA